MSDSDSSDDELILAVCKTSKKTKILLKANAIITDDDSETDSLIPLHTTNKPKKRKLEESDVSDFDLDDDEKINFNTNNTVVKKRKLTHGMKKIKKTPNSKSPIVVKSVKKEKKKKHTKKKKKKKKKKIVACSASVSKTPRRVKKIYDMPGQRRETPSQLNGLRIFYESLVVQIPTSKMAKEWLFIHGLLPVGEAEKMLKEKEKEKRKSLCSSARRGTPRRTPKRAKKKKKRKTPGSKRKTPKKKTPRIVKVKRKLIAASSDSESSSDEHRILRKTKK